MTAQQNRKLLAAEERDRALNTAHIGKLEAETRKLNSPFDAIASIENAYNTAQTNNTPFGLDEVGIGNYLRAGKDTAPLITPFLAGDADRASAMLGSGHFLGPNDAVSIADREGVARRNQANEIQQIFAKPVEVNAGATAFLGANDPRGDVLHGVPSFASAKGAILTDIANGKEVTPFAAASVLPQSGEIGADGVTKFGPTLPYGPLGKTQTGNSQENLLQSDVFLSNLKRYRELIAANPASVGLPGAARGAVQDVTASAHNFAQAFGYKSLDDAVASVQAELIKDMQENGADISPSILRDFDPSIAQIDQISNVLAYQYAKALDPDGRISDRDYKAAKQSLGDPRGVFQNSLNLNARLDEAERQVQAAAAIHRGALGLPASPFNAPAGAAVRKYYTPDGELIDQ